MSDFTPDHVKAKRHADKRKESVKITSNYQERDLFSIDQVPMRVAFDQFDYVLEDKLDINTASDFGTRFFKYRDYWYDINEFTSITDKGYGFTLKRTPSLAYWDGIQSDSHSSGVLVRLTEDGVIVGSYYG